MHSALTWLRARTHWIALAAGIAVLLGAVLYASVRQHRRDAVMLTDPEMILSNPDVSATAIALGRTVFLRHCATCHGTDARGIRRLGAPDLADRERLYGTGQVAEIEAITLHGIRSGDPKGWNLASMPAFASAKPYAAEPISPLKPAEISDVVEYLLILRGQSGNVSAARRGAEIFGGRGACWDCHAHDGMGDTSIGAPNLTDGIWLHGNGSRQSLYRLISRGSAASSPAFSRILSPLEARSVAVYVASLGAAQSGHMSKDDRR